MYYKFFLIGKMRKIGSYEIRVIKQDFLKFKLNAQFHFIGIFHSLLLFLILFISTTKI